MEIIIGRHPSTRQLCIKKGLAATCFGQANSVPMDVSRNHISLTSMADGKWLVKNLNEQNVTYVNGLPIESKVVTEADKIELGSSHYLLSWDAVRGPKVETVDIKPLKKVWATYNLKNVEIRKRQKNIGLFASLPIAFTMLGGLLSGVASEEFKPYAFVFTGIAFLVMVYGLYCRATDNSVDEQERIKKDFQRNYICPKCHRFLGFADYEILSQNDACPYCKTRFKK